MQNFNGNPALTPEQQVAFDEAVAAAVAAALAATKAKPKKPKA